MCDTIQFVLSANLPLQALAALGCVITFDRFFDNVADYKGEITLLFNDSLNFVNTSSPLRCLPGSEAIEFYS